MAIKTFTTGEVLTAADTNTYLANSGLVFVSSTTVGSAVSSVTVSSCFSATFDAYRIVATNVVASGTLGVGFQLSGITTGYYGNLVYSNFLGGAPASVGFNNIGSISYAAGTQGQMLFLNMDVINPFLSKAKFFNGNYCDQSNAGTMNAQNNQTNSATGFVVSPNTGTFTGGQITVYGYRKG
jgi:hypothetical protein